MKNKLKSIVENSIFAKKNFFEKYSLKLIEAIDKMEYAIKNGNKILICGNGGSAADAQHFAGELVNRFFINRNPLPAMALTTDTSVITSIANDFSFDEIFSKQIQAIGKRDDVLIGISTSGNSKNVQQAILTAKELGIFTVALLGKTGGNIKNLADISLVVENESTPRIQEVHILILHIIAQFIEENIFNEN